MHLFRSEEHVRRWPQHTRAVDDYVMPIADWAEVFGASLFRRRLDSDYLERSADYLEDYRDALRAKGKAVPVEDRILSTVLFVDMVGSTSTAASMGDVEWGSLLERYHDVARAQIGGFHGQEVGHSGDGFMATFTAPTAAIGCALAIAEATGELGITVRAGIHSGEIEVLADGYGGMAVHIAARIESVARDGEVLVSRTVRDAVIGSQFDLISRGEHKLKGVPGSWELFAVAG
jgi:class 3 adenylate cyclase